MSLSLPLPLPTLARPSRGRGRPRADKDLRQRDLHYKAAHLYFVNGLLAKQIAGAFDVTEPTVFRWIRLALTHDDDRTEAIRQVIRRTRLGRKWLRRVDTRDK